MRVARMRHMRETSSKAVRQQLAATASRRPKSDRCGGPFVHVVKTSAGGFGDSYGARLLAEAT